MSPHKLATCRVESNLPSPVLNYYLVYEASKPGRLN